MTDLDRLDAPTPTTSAGRFVVAYVRQRLGDEAGDATAVHVADAEEEASAPARAAIDENRQAYREQMEVVVRERDELRDRVTESIDALDDVAEMVEIGGDLLTEITIVQNVLRAALHREAGA